MKITTLDKDVKGVLSSNYYNIPRFQRPYSWAREHIEDYWNDTIAESDEDDYFIGSMVIYRINSDVCGVVDGQQRMTTIMMLLCALRDEMINEGYEDLARGIHSLLERPNIDNKPVYVLTTETSYPYFQEYILKYEKSDIFVKAKAEEKNLSSAFCQIKELVKNSIDAIRNDPSFIGNKRTEKIKNRLLEIRDKILSPKLIFVELENEDDAYAIFETLNTRGKELGVSDLIKTLLTRLIKTKNVGIDTVAFQWGRIVDCIGDSSEELDLNTFIHHFWLSMYEYLPVKKLYKSAKKVIRKTNAQSFLNELEADSTTYREINEPSYRVWEKGESEIKRSLEAYKIFKIKQDIPMVLAVMRDYKKGILKQKDVDRILRAIEHFHFIFSAVTSQRSSGGISQMYASAGRMLAKANTREEKILVINELIKKLKEKIPSYREFEADFIELKYSNKFSKQKELVKYILEGLHRNSIKDIVVDYDKMTIEHITPQRPQLSSNCKEENIGNIGNLILVPASLNDELGNKSFNEKQRILRNNGVMIDPIVSDTSDWNDEAIEKRTVWMADLAYKKIWKV